jgi:hypothetical protein
VHNSSPIHIRPFTMQIGHVYVGHFAIIDNVIYCVNPPMLEWVNPLYFLSLADIQEVCGCLCHAVV